MLGARPACPRGDSSVRVGSCQLILRCPKDDELELASFLKTVKQDWRDLADKGRISKLSIHCVDHLEGSRSFRRVFTGLLLILGA